MFRFEKKSFGKMDMSKLVSRDNVFVSVVPQNRQEIQISKLRMSANDTQNSKANEK